MKFKKKVTTSVQFEEHQFEWLENKAIKKSQTEQRKVSIAEINREVLQRAIESEKDNRKPNKNA